MGKHGKYVKHYREEWEKLPNFKGVQIMLCLSWPNTFSNMTRGKT